MTDKEQADAFRKALETVLILVCDLLKEADHEGFNLSFNIKDCKIEHITVAKRL